MLSFRSKFFNITKYKEDGFTLIDTVVTVAIVMALSVGGYISYTSFTNTAAQTSVDAAADEVYTVALGYENDRNPDNDAETAVEEFNKLSGDVKVEIVE